MLWERGTSPTRCLWVAWEHLTLPECCRRHRSGRPPVASTWSAPALSGSGEGQEAHSAIPRPNTETKQLPAARPRPPNILLWSFRVKDQQAEGGRPTRRFCNPQVRSFDCRGLPPGQDRDARFATRYACSRFCLNDPALEPGPYGPWRRW